MAKSSEETTLRDSLAPEDQSGPERIAPSMGKKSDPIEVKLDEDALKALAEEFASEIGTQYEAQAQMRRDITQYLQLYRATPKRETKEYPLAHSSNVVVAIIANYTDQIVARIMGGIFGAEPHWMVEELNKQWAPVCKPYERYLDWSRKNVWNQYEMVHNYVLDCVKLGTAIGYNDFVHEPMFRYDDQQKKTVQTGWKIGPRPIWIPRERFMIPIGYTDHQMAPYCGHQDAYSWDRLEQLSYQGVIDDIDELKGAPDNDEDDDLRAARTRNREQTVDSEGDGRFGIWRPWWIWFRRDLDRDGWPEEYVMLLHIPKKKILRLVANPSPSGTRPYFVSRFIKMEGAFDGIGVSEQLESYQDEISTIHNQRRDRAHLANIVMYKARQSAAGLTDTIRPISGLVIKLPDITDLEEFHPSTNVPIDIQEEDYVTRNSAARVGMNDVDQGKVSSPVGRAAATTIMAVMQETARRFDLNVAGIRYAISEEGHQITELWQIYGLPPPDQTGSPEQVLGPEDGQLVRQLIEQPAINLKGLINIQLQVATAAVNKEVEKRSNIELFGIVSSYQQQMLQLAQVIANPMVPPEIKAAILHGVQGMDKLLDKVFQAHNAFDLDSVLVGELFQALAERSMQQAQAMAQAGINPQAPQVGGPAQGPQSGGPPVGGAGAPAGGGNGQVPPQVRPPKIPPPKTQPGPAQPMPGPTG